VQLSDGEREACDRASHRQEQVGAKLPLDPIPLQKRAYYDAIAEAYREVHDTRTPASEDVGGSVWRSGGHPPGAGCSSRKPPPNSLHIGPCFISPPQGLFTEESAVQKPY
jgi:hypothetical protein